MTVKNLLVELFVEELPPKALKKLGDAFAGVLLDQLKAQGLATADIGAHRLRLAAPPGRARHARSLSRRRRQGRVAEADAGERRPRRVRQCPRPRC
jgi:glycyl-tRNA synthetase beta chain